LAWYWLLLDAVLYDLFAPMILEKAIVGFLGFFSVLLLLIVVYGCF